ncbi:MAG: prolyl oligopeptidase family serine peptidase [Bacteroidales bacterium]|nr:prolyl oligopeptidase family serine peptidase [Bacteroidales bacterium]
MKKNILFLYILIFASAISCIGGKTTVTPSAGENVIEKGIQVLEKYGAPKTSQGMLILNRYRFYLSELEKGHAYIDWRPYTTSPINNATVFLRLMDQGMIGKIVKNTREDLDAFHGITGFLERAYVSVVDGSLDSYLVYIPHSFQPPQKYPLVVMLHGYGDSAYLNPLSPAHFDFLKACEKRRVIMVAPCARYNPRGQMSTSMEDAETDILQVLDLVKQDYPVDENRIYLTGLSMGGFGTYWLASRQPELFAAIAPVCGIWSGTHYTRVNLDALKDIPVLLVHGDLDKTVPVSESRTAFEYLQSIGAEVEYREIKISQDDPWDYGIFGGHNAWDYAYMGTSLLDWLLEHKQDR